MLIAKEFVYNVQIDLDKVYENIKKYSLPDTFVLHYYNFFFLKLYFDVLKKR